MPARWTTAAAVYCRPRLLFVLAMGFASGLPLLLTLSTLSYWLAKLGVDKTTIGLAALLGLPYTLKFLWAPLLDRAPPRGLRRLGRRRGWLLPIQLALALAVWALGHTDPLAAPLATGLVALAIAFLSASQDVVIDAYRIEILDADEQGAGAGATQLGYRLGLLSAGAGAIALSDYVAWPAVFAALAGLAALNLVVTLAVPVPAADARIEPAGTVPFAERLRVAILEPFRDFAGRAHWPAILAFVLLYKFGDALSGGMANPFYVEMGFTGSEIAAIAKVFGIWATIIGGLVGGMVVARYGTVPTLALGGVLQATTNLLFAALALRGHDLAWLTLAIAADNLAGGLASAAFVAYLSGLCASAYTATQYALLTSLMAVGMRVFAAGGGWLAERLGWVWFWSGSALIALPGLALLWWLQRRGVTSAPTTATARNTPHP